MENNDLLQNLLTLEKEHNEKAILKIVNDKELENNPALQYYIAHLYYVGYIYEKDLNKCLNYLKASAVSNYASACYMLSTLYEKGEGVDIDLEVADSYLLKAVSNDYLPALNHYGEILLSGRVVIKKDETSAFETFKKCHELGYKRGSVNYAYCLLFKVGNNENQELGFSMMASFAEEGISEAQYFLGKAYLDAVATNKDVIRGTYYLLRSTENNNADACKLLGDCYYDGLGVAINHKAAFMYYKKAADLGSGEACQLVANCYVAGDGVKMSFKEAVNYCVIAANYGDKQAQVSLGNRYYYGNGLRRNYHRAFYYYQEAARQDDPIGLKSAADMLDEGKGCKKDVKKAIEYYIKAVNLNNFDAAAPLADIYAKGRKGIKRDYSLALQYYEIAWKEKDDEECAYIFGDLLSQGLGSVYADFTKAAKAFEFAAGKGHLPAIKKIAEYYLKGIGVNKDYERALRYYLEGSKMGDEESAILVNLIRRSMEFTN